MTMMKTDQRGVRASILLMLSLIFIIFLSPLIHAQDESPNQDAILEGETFSVGDGGSISIFDYDIDFVLDADAENIFVDEVNSDDYEIISLEDCGTIDLIDICFDRTSGSTIYARIFANIPFITFQSSIEESETYVGQDNRLNLTLKNEGEAVSNSTSVEVKLPNSVRAYDALGADIIDDNTISWDGEINVDHEHEIGVRFIHLEETVEDNIVAELEYNSFFGIETIPQSQAFSTEDAFAINASTEPEDLYLGTPFDVKINITNILTDEDDNPVNATIDRLVMPLSSLPGLSDHSGFVTQSDSDLFWSGRIRPGKSKIFELSLDPSSSGILELPMRLTLNDTIEEETGTQDFRFFFPNNITSRDIGVNISLPSASMNSSSEHSYNVTLTNVDSSLEFTDINVSMSAHEDDENYFVESLSPNEQYVIEDVPLLLPPSNVTSSESLEVTIDYLNDYSEERQISEKVYYDSLPIRELEVEKEIEEIDEGSFRIDTYVNNVAEIDTDGIEVYDELHDDIFFTGSLNGSLPSLESGERELISSYRISSSGLNFSAEDYAFSTYLDYEISGVAKSFSDEHNLTGMVSSLYDDPTVLQQTEEVIQRYFTSTTVFGIFVFAMILIAASITTVVLNKHKFSIQGYDSLKRKQQHLERQKEKFKVKENTLERNKQKLQSKIHELKDFMSKTKSMMEREVPVLDEKKDGLKTRQEELLEEKKVIDQKIEELKEIEKRLLKRNSAYQKELRELDEREKKLNDRFETVKSRLSLLNKEMDRILSKENDIGKKKEKLNKEEQGVLAEKQRLIKMGSEKFSTEKVDVVKEKINLQHEKNLLQEELRSLGDRKKDINEAQDSIHQQKADLQKEKNIFDMDKDAVENSLNMLKSQSTKIKQILDESRSTYIEKPEKESSTRKGGKKRNSKQKNK